MTQTVLLVVGAPGAVVTAASVIQAQEFVTARTQAIANLLRSQSAPSVSYEASELAQQLAASTLSMFDNTLSVVPVATTHNSSGVGIDIFCLTFTCYLFILKLHVFTVNVSSTFSTNISQWMLGNCSDYRLVPL